MRHKHRHWFGRARRGNCLLFVVCLFLRGRVVRMFRRHGHWLGLTARGTVVHLKCLDPADRHARWYYGRPHAFRTG